MRASKPCSYIWEVFPQWAPSPAFRFGAILEVTEKTASDTIALTPVVVAQTRTQREQTTKLSMSHTTVDVQSFGFLKLGRKHWRSNHQISNRLTNLVYAWLQQWCLWVSSPCFQVVGSPLTPERLYKPSQNSFAQQYQSINTKDAHSADSVPTHCTLNLLSTRLLCESLGVITAPTLPSGERRRRTENQRVTFVFR